MPYRDRTAARLAARERKRRQRDRDREAARIAATVRAAGRSCCGAGGMVEGRASSTCRTCAGGPADGVAAVRARLSPGRLDGARKRALRGAQERQERRLRGARARLPRGAAPAGRLARGDCQRHQGEGGGVAGPSRGDSGGFGPAGPSGPALAIPWRDPVPDRVARNPVRGPHGGPCVRLRPCAGR